MYYILLFHQIFFPWQLWWWWWIVFVVWLTHERHFSLISSPAHCQRSSPWWISDTPRAGFEPALSLSSGFVEWSCAVVITTTPQCYYCVREWLKINFNMYDVISCLNKNLIQHFVWYLEKEKGMILKLYQLI